MAPSYARKVEKYELSDIGYNFTDISHDLTDLDYDSQVFFLNLVDNF